MAVSNPPTPPTPLPIVKKTQFINDEPLKAALQDAGYWNEAELQRRQTLEDVCYLVLDGSRAVHFSWVTARSRHNTEIGFQVDPNEKNPWIYNSYTAPTHRGRSIYLQVLQTIAADINTQDDRKLWIDVQDDNQPSVRGIGSAGFVEAALFEKKVLFSHWVFGRRITLLHPALGTEFTGMSPRWT